jgi:hypothetical protein
MPLDVVDSAQERTFGNRRWVGILKTGEAIQVGWSEARSKAWDSNPARFIAPGVYYYSVTP